MNKILPNINSKNTIPVSMIKLRLETLKYLVAPSPMASKKE